VKDLFKPNNQHGDIVPDGANFFYEIAAAKGSVYLHQ
jgi:hypothetical protein